MTDYREILVHVDDTRSSAGRISLARDIARDFDAQLTGIYVDTGLRLPAVPDLALSPSLIDALEQEERDRRDRAKAEFDRVIGEEAVSAEWCESPGEILDVVNARAKYADLVIVGQEGDEESKVVIGGLPDSLVLGCGRPMLVVPYIGAPRPVAECIMVAWNASREAVRAVHDALPLLRRAKQVQVVCINSESTEEFDADLPGAELCRHLARHGVSAEAQQISATDIDVGNVLLSRAADHGAGLIVMGAYGHARWREIVLGGATNHLLQSMTVPVLMSH